MRIAVTGATGHVGRFVVADLLARGHAVKAWARPASDRSGFAGAIDWIAGGLDRPGSERALVAGADALVHAAFQHVAGRYRGGEGDDAAGFMAANRDGSLRLLDAAAAAGVPRVVFLSSRAVYGSRLWDRPLDEAHPARPDTLYGAYKLEIEQALAARAAGRAWASLRSTGVFGLRRPLALSKWFEVVRASLEGEVPPSRGGTEVAGADLARAVRILLEAEPAMVARRVFNVSDVYVTHRAVTRLAGGVLAPRSGPPTGLMQTDRLQALGWRPQGWAGVRATVRALAFAVQRAGRSERQSESATK